MRIMLSCTTLGALLMSMPCANTGTAAEAARMPSAADRAEPASSRRSIVFTSLKLTDPPWIRHLHSMGARERLRDPGGSPAQQPRTEQRARCGGDQHAEHVPHGKKRRLHL